ncbi:MAG TPA: carbohydrate ABC transporter permease [Firmicutes bacterium]|nr:carbohydrate ABC transporter permease [Bacillota bacterium]
MSQKAISAKPAGLKKKGPTFNQWLNRQKHKVKQAPFWKNVLLNIFLLILFTGLVYVLIYPVIYIVSTSLKSQADMLDSTTVWVPKHPSLSNYPAAFEAIDYLAGLKNTLIIAVTTTVLQTITCSFIGYGFARFKFKEKNLIFALVILTLIIPVQTIVLPQYLQYRTFDIFGIFTAITGGPINLVNTFVPLILPSFFGVGLKSGLFIYLFRQFYRGMPKELEEAGYIDGCGPFRTYMRIMWPNATAPMVSVILLSFVWHWNDVFEPDMYLESANRTLAVRLVNITSAITGSSEVTNLTYVIPTKYAGCGLFILPLIIVYLVGQRYFVEGMERAGIVG